MSSTTLERPPPEIISEICGFRRVFLPEVARLIQSHSQSHRLWRYCSVLKLVQDLELAESLETATYPLSKVLSWSRGENPKLVQDGHVTGSFIELKIDARGVKSVERISKVAISTGSEMPASSFVFAVEPVEKISDAKMEFEACKTSFCSILTIQYKKTNQYVFSSECAICTLNRRILVSGAPQPFPSTRNSKFGKWGDTSVSIPSA